MKPLVLVSFLLAGIASGFSASFSAGPSADAFVTTGPGGELVNNNYGGAGALSLAAPGLAKGEFQTVVRFNLAGALAAFDTQFGAGQWSVSSVTLQIAMTSGNNPIFNPAAAGSFGIAWMQNDTWTEGNGGPGVPATSGISFSSLQSTFNSPADEALGTFNANGTTSGVNLYTLALSPGFAADLASGGEVSLRMFATDTAVSAVFNSRSFATTANRPSLTVVAVPEPSLLALAGLGCALVMTWNVVRKKKA